MKQLRALDLFCGEGGATRGLQRAGFHVTGVDHKAQPRYCGDKFYQHDAMHFPLWDYDFIWASPPCQSYSRAMRHLATPQPKLIDAMRARLKETKSGWVIENVPGAPMRNSMTLCGTQFGLRVHRHRLFEAPWWFTLMPACDRSTNALNPHNAKSRAKIYAEFGRKCGGGEVPWAKEMGVEWMSRQGAREAIPPAYSEFIARAFLAQMRSAA